MSLSELFKKIASRLVIGNCLGMVLLSLLLGVGAWFFIGAYTRHGEVVSVPDVCGLDENTARNKLKALGLKAEVTDTGYVYNAAPYAVLEQSIRPGEQVKPSRTVGITINANGPRQIALPDVADNCSRREAEDRLRTLGFRLGATEYIVGDPDWVYGVKVNGREVAAGTRLSVKTPVTLVVGGGGYEDEYNGNDSLDFIINSEQDAAEHEVLEE